MKYKIITKKYASKSDIIQEIRNINYKINKLKEYQQYASDKIIQQMEEMQENILKKIMIHIIKNKNTTNKIILYFS